MIRSLCSCMFVANDGLQPPFQLSDIDDSTEDGDLLNNIACGGEKVCAWREGVGCHVLSIYVFRVLFLAPCPGLSRSLSEERVLSRSPLGSESAFSIHIYPCVAMLVQVVWEAQLVQPKRANSVLSQLLRCWRQPRGRYVLRVSLALDTRIAFFVRSRLIIRCLRLSCV